MEGSREVALGEDLATAIAEARSWKDKYERAQSESQRWKEKYQTTQSDLTKAKAELRRISNKGGDAASQTVSSQPKAKNAAPHTELGRPDAQPPAKIRLSQKQRKQLKEARGVGADAPPISKSPAQSSGFWGASALKDSEGLPKPPPPPSGAQKAAAEKASAAHQARDSIATKLRDAAMTGDKQALEVAVAEAEAAGLLHEATLGRRKLATL